MVVREITPKAAQLLSSRTGFKSIPVLLDQCESRALRFISSYFESELSDVKIAYKRRWELPWKLRAGLGFAQAPDRVTLNITNITKMLEHSAISDAGLFISAMLVHELGHLHVPLSAIAHKGPGNSGFKVGIGEGIATLAEWRFVEQELARFPFGSETAAKHASMCSWHFDCARFVMAVESALGKVDWSALPLPVTIAEIEQPSRYLARLGNSIRISNNQLEPSYRIAV